MACWAPHLQSWLPQATPEEVQDWSEKFEVFLDAHYSEPGLRQLVSKSVGNKLKILESLDTYDDLVQCIVWMQKLLMADKVEESNDMMDFPRITTMIRSASENISLSSLSTETSEKLKRYYGVGWFKCPRIYCQHFYSGFRKPEDRDAHDNRHDRPFMCTISSCPTATFGCVSKPDLDKHMLNSHGICDDTEQFPILPDRHDDVRKGDGEFQCPSCPRCFQYAYLFRRHVKSHLRDRRFKCTVCGKDFFRDYDRKRHENLHGEKKFICQGNRVKWGCGKRFAREDALREHLKTKLGSSCLKALAQEYPGSHQNDLVDLALRGIE